MLLFGVNGHIFEEVRRYIFNTFEWDIINVENSIFIHRKCILSVKINREYFFFLRLKYSLLRYHTKAYISVIFIKNLIWTICILENIPVVFNWYISWILKSNHSGCFNIWLCIFKENMLEYQGRRDTEATKVALADITAFVKNKLSPQ